MSEKYNLEKNINSEKSEKIENSAKVKDVDESGLCKVFKRFLEKESDMRNVWVEKKKNKYFKSVLKGLRKNLDFSSEVKLF